MKKLFASVYTIMICSLLNGQTVVYKKIVPPVERVRIAIGELSVYAIYDLNKNMDWVHFIEPRWKPSLGIIENDLLDTVFQIPYDGHFAQSHFYQSADNVNEYIVASVHGYDDGLSSTYYFKLSGKTAIYLGSLFLLKKVDNDPFIGGYYGIYPDDELSISSINNQIRFTFASGEYITMKDGQEIVVNGPLVFSQKLNALVPITD